MRRRLSVHRGIDGQDHLLDAIDRDPFNEAWEVQVLGTYAVERRQGSAQHMIARAENSGAFERPEIGHRLDDDERVAVAPLIPAQSARIAGIGIATGAAGHDFFARNPQSIGKRREKFLALAYQMQRGAARRAWAKPRQTR